MLAEAAPSRNLNNALWSRPRLSSPHTQTVKPGFNAVGPWELKIGPRMFIVQIQNQQFFHWWADDKLVCVCVYSFFTPLHRCCCAKRGIWTNGSTVGMMINWKLLLLLNAALLLSYIHHSQEPESTASKKKGPLCLISLIPFLNFK